MSLWEMGIFIVSIFFVLELRRIRKKCQPPSFEKDGL
jgi:hypothetical protein